MTVIRSMIKTMVKTMVKIMVKTVIKMETMMVMIKSVTLRYLFILIMERSRSLRTMMSREEMWK
jgi:hypothetical protein